MAKQFDIIKDSIREILEENNGANVEKIFTTLAIMRLIENTEESFEIVKGLVEEVQKESKEKYDDLDLYSILKNPAHLKHIIAEAKKTSEGKMTLKMIVEMVENEPEEIKHRIGEMQFYMIKTELANGLNMLNKQIVGDRDLSESVYWERKI